MYDKVNLRSQFGEFEFSRSFCFRVLTVKKCNKSLWYFQFEFSRAGQKSSPTFFIWLFCSARENSKWKYHKFFLHFLKGKVQMQNERENSNRYTKFCSKYHHFMHSLCFHASMDSTSWIPWSTRGKSLTVKNGSFFSSWWKSRFMDHFPVAVAYGKMIAVARKLLA